MFCYDMLLQRKTSYAKLPSYLTKQQPYILEIENESRKFVLAAKSQFDLEEWYTAIYAQIESLTINEHIATASKLIV